MPHWEYKLPLKDIFHNEDLTFEKRRDEIVHRIKVSSFYAKDQHGYLGTIVEHLEDAKDWPTFNSWWDEFYDYADEERVWVATV